MLFLAVKATHGYFKSGVSLPQRITARGTMTAKKKSRKSRKSRKVNPKDNREKRDSSYSVGKVWVKAYERKFPKDKKSKKK